MRCVELRCGVAATCVLLRHFRSGMPQYTATCRVQWRTFPRRKSTQEDARAACRRMSSQRIAPQRICVNKTFRGTRFVSILRYRLLVMYVPVSG